MASSGWRRWGVLGGIAVAMWALSASARPEAPLPPPLVVEVTYGDSLWTLARRHGDPSRDVRDVVTEIMHVNHVSPGQLRAGQKLLIPGECAAERKAAD